MVDERLSLLEWAPEYPDLEEASRIGRLLMHAEWLTGPVKKRFLEDPGRSMAKVIEKWARSVMMRDPGLRVVQSRRAFISNIATVIVKARHQDNSCRVLYVTAFGMEKVKLRGAKGVMPKGVIVFYGRANGKIRSLFDKVKPRMDRSFLVAGYTFRVVRRILKTGELRIYAKERVKCERSVGVIDEIQRKYVIIIPPFIFRRWFYDAEYEAVISESLEDLCHQIMV